MTFDRAAALVPYLADLGISHLYASPMFTAVSGSSHGYDVINHQELDPSLGGAEGFGRLASYLKAHGLGLILDIVPNHMAASTENPWWRDVLKRGRESAYARHFDIDWGAPKLLLPVLGEPYGDALGRNLLQLRIDDRAGELTVGYHDLSLPVSQDSYRLALPVRYADEAAFARALRDPVARQEVEAAVDAANVDQELIHAIHEAQAWRLAYWRLAREALTYRRFFEIADLVGIRVEDRSVFADVHELPLRLVRDGLVDGLRIDHIDGLADPKGYLEHLYAASGLDGVWVEKILGPGEDLRHDWRCAGTTGYEVGSMITALQVDGANRAATTRAWTDFTGDDSSFTGQVLGAKRRTLTVNLAGELEGLVQLAHRIATQSPLTRDFGRDALRLALVELVAALPVYRTYIDTNGASEEDRALIGRAAERVDRGREAEDERVIEFLVSLLLGPAETTDRAAFIRRFQQTTGPLMAKAVEDTVFYRYNRLIALNEVGADPDEFGIDLAAFHAAMGKRARTWPFALSATATHDTKRGEDARARLAVLSEVPQAWEAAVRRWRAETGDLRKDLPGRTAPGPRAEWLFYQALAGAWPPELAIDDEDGLAGLCERLVSFMMKALREAKIRTSWTDQNEPFEAAVEAYVRGVFAPERRQLLDEVRSVIASIESAGVVNALSQLALKLTLPGVPDIYQGCELPDHSLVDPDNRREVDFGLRQQLLKETRLMTAPQAMRRWRDGLPKLWLTERMLRLRAVKAELFAHGDYVPVTVTGDGAARVVAFARSHGGDAVVVAVPRLVLQHIDGELLWIPGGELEHTRLHLPPGLFQYRNLAGEDALKTLGEAGQASVLQLWTDFPVAILYSEA